MFRLGGSLASQPAVERGYCNGIWLHRKKLYTPYPKPRGIG